jgi:hypothetical protein
VKESVDIMVIAKGLAYVGLFWSPYLVFSTQCTEFFRDSPLSSCHLRNIREIRAIIYERRNIREISDNISLP